ncbi:MAG: kinase [Eubacterium sp.]|nr:kinase [Eubacterium sp.]
MIITRTPLRISFFGGGTDLPDYYLNRGGEVISTTIDKYLYITCRHMPPFWDYKHRLVYGSKSEFVSNIDDIEHPSIRETLRFLNIDYGVDMHYNTDIPARSGIGSSSSFTVGLLNALNGLDGKISSKHQLMRDSIYIEQKMIKEPVGAQDQTAAAYGGFNHIIFRKDGEIEAAPITISEGRIRELNDSLLLVFTGFQRYSKNIEEKKIQNINDNIARLDTMKKYVSDAMDILNSDVDIREFGALLNETWKMKKTLADNVTDERIDGMYRLGMENGAVGGKLLGAGGGGFMLFFVSKEKREELKKALKDYICVPFRFENAGSQVIYYKQEEEKA